jgi:hypothetical protein
MTSFNCGHCGAINPLEKLEPKPRNKRTSFMRVLAEFARETNPVTRSVRRDILKGRLDRNDLS